MAWLDVARCRLDEDCICICICILHAVLQECVRRYICTRRIDDWCKGRVCSCWKLLRDGNYQISRDVPETATTCTFYLLPSRVGKPFLLSYYGMRPGNLVIIPFPPHPSPQPYGAFLLCYGVALLKKWTFLCLTSAASSRQFSPATSRGRAVGGTVPNSYTLLGIPGL